MFKLFYSFTLLVVIGCTNQHNNKIIDIKKEFSTETINYFYEAMYNEDSVNLKLVKWNKNILYFLEGHKVFCEKVAKDCADSINKLNLPVKVYQTSKKDKANLIIRCDSLKNLPIKDNNTANSVLYSTKWFADSAIINFSIDKSSGFDETNLFHEFFHTLGIRSHITTQSDQLLSLHAIVFPTYYNKQEKDALRLLYSLPIYKNKEYCRSDFEYDFASVIYIKNWQEKFLNYIRKNNIPIEVIAEISQNCVAMPSAYIKEPQLFKCIKPILIQITGENTNQNKTFVLNAIEEINSISPNIQLNYSENTSLGEGILLEINKDKENKIRRFRDSYSGYKNVRYIPRTGRWIQIYYKQGNNARLQDMILTELYLSITGFDLNYNKSVLRHGVHKSVITDFYKLVLRTIYTPELAFNAKKSELEKLAKKIR